MNRNRKKGITLLITALIVYAPGTYAGSTPACSYPFSTVTINSLTGSGSNALSFIIPVKRSDDQKARVEQLRRQLTDMLTRELGIDTKEAEDIILTAKYLTPSGRDINKIVIINSKLFELQQLENSRESK